MEEYGSRYCLIGPLSHRSAAMEVESLPIESCQDPAMAAALKTIASQGVHFVYGRWLVESAPTVLLLDLNASRHRLNEWKAHMWESMNVPSPDYDSEMNDAILFGFLTAWFLGEVNYASLATNLFLVRAPESDAGGDCAFSRMARVRWANVDSPSAIAHSHNFHHARDAPGPISVCRQR
jgi:hypothetical protein